jgi:hypothetical protein
MLITGLSLEKFREIVTELSVRRYNGNVIVHQDAHALSGNRFRARLTVQDSYAYGARLSPSRRHTRAASWEAYRDVLSNMFFQFPNATARTREAVYQGEPGFLMNYPATGRKNVGSMVDPVTYPELSVPIEGHSRRGYTRVDLRTILPDYISPVSVDNSLNPNPVILAVDEEWSSEKIAEWLMTDEGTAWSRNRHIGK